MGLIDKAIPYYNALMRCDTVQEQEIKLPHGYRFRTYREGDAEEWARLEVAVRDFDTFNHAVAYLIESMDLIWLSCRGDLSVWKARRETQRELSLHGKRKNGTSNTRLFTGW